MQNLIFGQKIKDNLSQIWEKAGRGRILPASHNLIYDDGTMSLFHFLIDMIYTYNKHRYTHIYIYIYIHRKCIYIVYIYTHHASDSYPDFLDLLLEHAFFCQVSFKGDLNKAKSYPIGSMVLVYIGILMLTWMGYFDGIHVTIYSSTMDPMGISLSV